MNYLTKSSNETKNIAAEIALRYKDHGGVILLTGELGSGKTTFTQGFAKALGIDQKIISPTFVLIRQHEISTEKTLFHIDLYRMNENTDSKEIGLAEMAQNPNNIILIEWPERLTKLPENCLTVEIKIVSPMEREIRVV